MKAPGFCIFLMLASLVLLGPISCHTIVETPVMLQERTVLKAATQFRAYSLTFSPNSKYIAASFGDGTISVWDVETGTERFSVAGKKDPKLGIYSVAFSSDSEAIVWVSELGEVELWDVNTKKNITRFGKHPGHGIWVNFVGFIDKEMLVTGTNDGVIRLWSLKSKQEKVLWQEKNSGSGGRSKPLVQSIAFDPELKNVAVGVFDAIAFVNVEKGGPERIPVNGLETLPISLNYNLDCTQLAGIAGKVAIWDVQTGKEIKSLTKKGAVSLAYSPDGKMMAVGIGKVVNQPSFVEIWDLGNTRVIASFRCHDDLFGSVSWSPDGKTLATCCATSPNIKLWTVQHILEKASK